MQDASPDDECFENLIFVVCRFYTEELKRTQTHDRMRFDCAGRFYANITDTLLTGRVRQWPEGSLHVVEYLAGATVTHSYGEASGVEFAAGTWIVETGRGLLPTTLPFALADSLFSTLDWYSVLKLLRVYSKAIVHDMIVNLT